jgi:IS30 family transposase
MGRSHTTIYRELRRNQHPEPKNYLPDTAQSQAVERRQQAKLPFSKFTLNIIENFGSETPSFYDGFTVKY